MELLSIVICTRNRSALLAQTLGSLTQMRIPEDTSWEVVVVDNASLDNTSEVATNFWSLLPIRVVREPEVGTSFARNAGAQNAGGDIIVWLDDDVIVDPGLLEAYSKAARQHPGTDIFGGCVEPYFPNEPPAWLKQELPSLGVVYSLRMELPIDGVIRLEHLPVAANMAVRSCVHRNIGFDPNLGRRGNTGPLGEETQLLSTAITRGHLGRWVPAARVCHYIMPSRQRPPYVREWFTSYAWALRSMQPPGESPEPQLCGFPRWAIRGLVEEEARYLLARLRGDHKSMVRALKNLGLSCGALRYCWDQGSFGRWARGGTTRGN